MAKTKTRIIGITGNIGSGKSSVAKLLVKKGAVLIDADKIAKEATNKPEILAQIAKELSEDLVTDGKLNRQKTADLIFNDLAAREKLNNIIHPWVRSRSRARIKDLKEQACPPQIILQDIPLLYENGLEHTVDAVIVVFAPIDERIKRVIKRSNLSEEDIKARDAAQKPLVEKLAQADYIIDNTKGTKELEQEVDRLWLELVKKN